MKPVLRVASSPAKPLLVFDGECDFCVRWIHRWKRATGDRVEYLPFQDSRIAARFPEIPPGQFESAVQLVQPDGAVCSGAEAVFRLLAFDSRRRWLLKWYQRSRVFAWLSECGYRFVGRNRQFSPR